MTVEVSNSILHEQRERWGRIELIQVKADYDQQRSSVAMIRVIGLDDSMIHKSVLLIKRVSSIPGAIDR
jgi:hypothetical protein